MILALLLAYEVGEACVQNFFPLRRADVFISLHYKCTYFTQSVKYYIV